MNNLNALGHAFYVLLLKQYRALEMLEILSWKAMTMMWSMEMNLLSFMKQMSQ